MDIKSFVAAHKPYRMPDDSMYEPLGVGVANQAPFCEVTDATGNNILRKKPCCCELTGLYWMRKNADAEYLGLVHYRRRFATRRFGIDKRRRVIQRPEIERMLKRTGVVIPAARHCFIETRWSQYAHTNHEIDLIKARECITELCQEYISALIPL